MTALQVRDFPTDLYKELKEFASANRRSMAQQTIEAVELMLHGHRKSPEISDCGKMRDAERMERRAAIIGRAQMRRMNQQGDIPNPFEVVSNARCERGMALGPVAKDRLGEGR